MNEPTMDTLKQRIDRLEREARRWRVLAFGLLAVWSLVILLGATRGVPDELKARRFVVVDETGTTRGSFSASGKVASLVLTGNTGRRRITLAVLGRGAPLLMFSDSSGARRLQLAQQPGSDMVHLSIWDRNNKKRALIGVGNQFSGVVLFDKDGKIIWKAQ